MSIQKISRWFAVLLVFSFLPGLSQAQFNCDISSLLELPDVQITSVESVDSPVPHCKAAGVIGTEIHFELLLPEQWNGKFVMGGGGGFVGNVQNQSMAYDPLGAGYATVGTDTGHQAGCTDRGDCSVCASPADGIGDVSDS